MTSGATTPPPTSSRAERRSRRAGDGALGGQVMAHSAQRRGRGATGEGGTPAPRRAGRGRRSAGILLYRRTRGPGIEILLVHPGGPLWARRDTGWWSIPKGEIAEGEDELACARREFLEETGQEAPDGPAAPLGEVRQIGGKRVIAWAVEGDVDVRRASGATFEMEWPPRSGRRRTFPEVDRAAWFTLEEARTKLLARQAPLVDRLRQAIDAGRDAAVRRRRREST